MAYLKTVWNNDTAPSINADNLNKMENGIFDNDKGVIDAKTALLYDSDVLKTTDEMYKYGGIVGGLKSDGTIDATLTTRISTDYIPVNPGEIHKFNGFASGSNTLWVCTYASDKTFKTYSTKNITTTSYEYEIEPDVFYIRLTVPKTLYDNGLSLRLKGNNIDYLENVADSISEEYFSTNLYNGSSIKLGYYIAPDGTETSNYDYCYMQQYIKVSEGDSICAGAYNSLPAKLQYVCAYDENKNVLSAKGTSTPSLVYTVPSGVSFIRVSLERAWQSRPKLRLNKSDRLLPYEAYSANPAIIQKNFSYIDSHNMIDPDVITLNKFMRKDGTTQTDSNYAYTSYIPVHEGDVVNIVKNGTLASSYNFRFITAFDENLSANESKGAQLVSSYTVPSGVTYIICTIFKASYQEGNLAININDIYPYDNYFVHQFEVDGQRELEDKIKELMNENQDVIIQEPLTSLPEYIVGNLYYKPLGELKKPYICLVTDDGRIGVNTYTIPMVMSKGVPCTFAIMKSSAIMADAANIAIVKNAIENGGCSVAQHGGVNWTEYTEKELNDFFDEEAAFFAEKGIPVNGAVIPSHYNSKMISALAGGRYGVARSGFAGNYEPTIYYGDFLAGPRSNLYMLPSYNFIYFETLERNKEIIDYAIANNLIAIIYWHEDSLLTEEMKAVLEGIIDYAKTQPITFITLGDIATKKVI